MKLFGKLQTYLFSQAAIIGVVALGAGRDSIGRGNADVIFGIAAVSLIFAALLAAPVALKCRLYQVNLGSALLKFFLVGLYYFVNVCLIISIIGIALRAFVPRPSVQSVRYFRDGNWHEGTLAPDGLIRDDDGRGVGRI